MITVNIYYTGIDGAAQHFAQEMVSSGTVDQICAEEAICDMNTSSRSAILRLFC